MNFKKVVRSAVFFTALIFLPVPGQASEHQTINTPQNVVLRFYTDYLTALNDSDIESGLIKSQNVIDKYTSKHLRKLQDQDDSGADYFFSAQDACPDWLSHISTTKEKRNNSVADVELNLGYGNSLSVYDIHLVAENGRWLMDSVMFKSRKTESCYQD